MGSRINYLLSFAAQKKEGKKRAADFDAELFFPRPLLRQNRRWQLNFIEHLLSPTLQDGMKYFC
jgi:hypothetical protein